MRGSVAILVAVLLGVISAPTVDVQIGTSTVLSTTWPTLASFNFDWWPRNLAPWQNAGLLNIDLTDPSLLYLTSQLAPANLRVGGTLGDTIIYEIGSHEACTAGINCFNTTRWDQVNVFVKATNIGLVFGLNEMYNHRKAGEKWNTTNVESFLSYTAEKGYGVLGFEIGNELNARLHPEDSAADAAALKTLLVKYWPNEKSRPLVIGPDDNADTTWWETYVRLSAPYIDVYTYHMYNGYGGDPNLPEQIPTTSFLDRSTSAANNFLKLIRKYTSKAQIWMGEGAAAYDSGQDGTTNSFESGFYYLNALGTQAQHQHTGSQRQALVGGYYELIDKHTFTPNPDYYVNHLWKKLMDVKVLSTTYPMQTNDIRIYAQCTPNSSSGSVTLAVINVSHNQTYTVNPAGITGQYPRQEYFLSAPDGNLRSRRVNLNGVTLVYANGKLPSFNPKVVSSGSLNVAPHTFGFVVFPNAKAQACIHQ